MQHVVAVAAAADVDILHLNMMYCSTMESTALCSLPGKRRLARVPEVVSCYFYAYTGAQPTVARMIRDTSPRTLELLSDIVSSVVLKSLQL